jgi:membrane protein YdbS with pleckstrin-like domain
MTETESGWNNLDPASVTANRVVYCIMSVCFVLASVVGGLVAIGAGMLAQWYWLLLVVLVLTNLVALLLAIFWPAIEHRHVKWSAGPVGVEIKRGVFWKHRIAIPWARVQHADVSQGPLARQFALGNLTIHTAGTKHASIEIEGLNHTVAIELRDEVIRQRKVGDVV